MSMYIYPFLRALLLTGEQETANSLSGELYCLYILSYCMKLHYVMKQVRSKRMESSTDGDIVKEVREAVYKHLYGKPSAPLPRELLERSNQDDSLVYVGVKKLGPRNFSGRSTQYMCDSSVYGSVRVYMYMQPRTMMERASSASS
jgi:hypothetical protein